MAEPVFVPIRNKRQTAVGAVQGLLSIVAGLGITNALRELFIRTSQVADWTPSLAAHQQKVNPIRQLIAILPWQSCPIPPWCTLPDLGTWYFPIIITIVQIIVDNDRKKIGRAHV